MGEVRTTRPTSGNKYFNRKARGGYSTCIQGKPTDSQCDVLANCVGYACGAYNEQENLGYEKYHLNCNAENFIERAIASGLSVVKTPVKGGIMVWQKGATLSGDDGAGHVAIALEDGGHRYAQSGYGSSNPFWITTTDNKNGRYGLSSGYTYRGCIAPKGWKPSPTPTTDSFPGVSDEELARRVWAGEFGNYPERANKLGSRYSAVQALVNKGVGKPSTPTPAPQPQPSKPDLLTMVRRTIRGDFGNYPARKTNIEKLGWDYATVQHQVNENVKRNNWNWDKIRLY